MNQRHHILTSLVISLTVSFSALAAPEDTPQAKAAEKTEKLKKHLEGAQQLAIDQDELAADAIELIEEQTNPKVIELLEQIEIIMGETVEGLDQGTTNGSIIAAETEIIEKIFEAAKKRQQDKKDGEGEKPKEGEGEGQKPGKGQGQGAPGDGMLEMMRRMMGEGQQGDGKPGEGKDGKKGGEGQTGDSDQLNKLDPNGEVAGKTEARSIPRASGTTPESLPREFHRALDAYNRGLEKKTPSPNQP